MRVLIVVHGFPPAAQGGSEVYAEAHARALQSLFGDEVVVLTRDTDLSRAEYDVRETTQDGLRVVRVNNTFRSVRTFEESYANPRIADIASRLIEEFRPDVAHVHHLTCLSTLIPQRLRAAGVPCFMTLHDYWLLCHRGQLLDCDYRVCSGPDGGCTRCVDVGASAPPLLGAAASVVRRVEHHLPQAARQALRAAGTRSVRALGRPEQALSAATLRFADMREVATHVEHFFAPSRHLLERFILAGFDAERTSLSPYGFDRALTSEARTPRRPGVLSVGFVGSLMASKAPHLLLEAASQLPTGTVSVHLFGACVPYHGDDSYRARLAPLLAAPHVTVHGSLPHADMRRAYEAMDVLVVPSIWPENSPLVIHEAFLAGVPVVAANIGGIPELIQHDVNGLLFDSADVVSLRDALKRLIDEPDLLDRLSGHRPSVRSIADDAGSMRERYARALDSRRTRTTAERPRVHAVVLNYHTPDTVLLAVRSLLASRDTLAGLTVVDNSSDVSCGRALADLSDRVDYLSTGSNLGYSGGMNIGIRRALASGATHVLLVNSDMTVPPDCLGRLLAAMARTPDAGIAGPTVLERSRPDRIASMGLSYRSRSGRMRQRLFGEPAGAARHAAGKVEAVSGCLMLVDRRVFERVGLLDDAYFFGFEDLDLCLRAKAHGLSTIVTAAVAYHEGAQSLEASSPDRLYYAARNHLRLAASTDASAGWFASTSRSLSIAGLNVAFALRTSPGRTTARLMAVARGVRDYRRGRFGPAR